MAPPEPDSRDRQGSNQQSVQQQQSSQNQDQDVTVETETVPTVATLGVLASAVNPSGTLRIKRSQDSVPRLSTRGKKRSQRLAQGSKADIFAAKVANAVDEHDSSGSDETFVYDVPQSHANDSIRRPLPRSYSHTGSIAGVNEDDYGYDSESDIEPISSGNGGAGTGNGGHGHGHGHGPGPGGSGFASSTSSLTVNTGTNGGSNTPHLGPISPKKSDQIPPRSPRNFVVPNRARRTNSSTFIPTTTHEYPEHSDHHNFEPPNTNAGGAQLNSPFMEIDNPYDDSRVSNWGRHIRKNSRSRPGNEKGGPNGAPNSANIASRDPNDSMRAKHSYLQRWRTPAHLPHLSDGTQSESDERTNLLKARPSLYNYQSSKSSQGRRSRQLSQGAVPFAEEDQLGRNQLGSSYGGTYGSVREQQPQAYPDTELGRQSDSSYDAVYAANTSTPMRVVLVAILLLVMLLFAIFVVGGFLAAKRPLEDFDVISLADVFVSDRELVFSLISHARNPGLLSVTVNKCELDIFATSAYAKQVGSIQDNSNGDYHDDHNGGVPEVNRAPRAVFLGTINTLESPIIFHGGLSSASQWRSTAAKLVEPLANNTKEWSQISAHEFDLTVKGTLSYDIFWSENIETVSRAYHVVAPEFLDGIHALI